jgi:predicted TIM-barrel fold metal-dependent hydrolase
VIIDAHAHIWPDHIAPRVLAERPVGLTPVGDGTMTGLLRTMDSAGVDVACALAVALSGATVARTNEFIGSVDRDRLVPFGTVHTDLSIAQNLAALADNGITAVKFHPLFQGIALDAPDVIELMQALADGGIIVLAHAGAGGDAAATERGSPAKVAKLVAKVPNLTLIACHFGGYQLLDDAERDVVGRRVVLETSWPPTVGELDGRQIVDMIAQHGAQRVVYGSDWPMAEPQREIAAVRGWGLAAEDEAAVLGGNLARLLGLT